MQRIKSLVLTLCLSWPATVVAQPAEAWVQRNVTQRDDVRRPPEFAGSIATGRLPERCRKQ